MNSDQLYLFLYNWIVALIPSAVVISSYDNGPAPTGTYLTVGIDGNWKMVGSTPAHITNDVLLVSPRVFQYHVDIDLREVSGNGDLLRTIIENSDTQATNDLCASAGCALLKLDGPTFMPVLDDANWKREYILRVNMMVARADSGSPEYIETVEFINNLGGS